MRLLRRRAAEPVTDGSRRWLVVGLGNPPAEYGKTRHNVGADTVRRLAERLGVSFKAHRKARAQVADTWARPGGTPLSLVLPHGYYNTAGGPAQQALAFYSVPLTRLVVVHDDIDLELGRLRLKFGGGTAGNNGLRDIQQRCGGPDFYRVRIGIGRPPGRMDAADYVLRPFPPRDGDLVDVTIERAADAVVDLVDLGLEAAQNRHHAA